MLITRYLLRQEAMAILLITLVITGAIWFSQSLKLLEMVVEGGAPLLIFFEMMLLVLPSFLVPIIPISLFLGLLFIMQKLLQDQEWIVMQGIGLGPFQLARPALILTAIVMVFHWAISIDIAPSAQRQLRFQRQLIQTDYAGALLREGTFNAMGKDITLYVRERSGSNLFRGILVHDTRTAGMATTLTAETGYLISEKGPPRLIIQNGTRQEKDLVTGKINWLLFDQYIIDLSMLKSAENEIFIKAYERPMHELFDPPSDIASQNAKKEFLAEAHERIVFPLYGLAFTLVALVVVLGGEFSRRGRPRRYLAGILFVIALQSVALALGNIAARENALIPIMYMPPIAVIMTGLIWMAKLRGLQKVTYENN
jgi:lipopolysaccharide export system permease protein